MWRNTLADVPVWLGGPSASNHRLGTNSVRSEEALKSFLLDKIPPVTELYAMCVEPLTSSAKRRISITAISFPPSRILSTFCPISHARRFSVSVYFSITFCSVSFRRRIGLFVSSHTWFNHALYCIELVYGYWQSLFSPLLVVMSVIVFLPRVSEECRIIMLRFDNAWLTVSHVPLYYCGLVADLPSWAIFISTYEAVWTWKRVVKLPSLLTRSLSVTATKSV